jgi:type IV secretion system protein VirB10
MAATTSMNLAGRQPRVVSAMSNGVLWVAVALGLLLLGAVVVGFRTRFAKKEQQAQATAAATVAHDAAQSNRTAVRNRAEPTPVSSLVGNAQSPGAAPGGGIVQTVGGAVVSAVKTDAHPFPNSPSKPGAAGPGGAAVPPPAPVYYYVPPAPQYAAPGTVTEDPVRRARERALERREQAMAAPTGIVANQNNGVAAQKSVDPIQAELDRIAQLSSAANSVPRPGLAGGGYTSMGVGVPAMGAGTEEYDLNQQNGKRKFQQDEEGDYLNTTRVAPISRWVVERGEKIVAILPTRVVSDLPGDLIAQVKDDVYNTPDHQFIMIPAGSLLAGEYNSSVSYGQGRVQVIWTYLRFPDGSFINLGKFVSHAADGAVGLKDQTDNHIKRLVGGVLLSSIFAAGIQISQNHSGANSTLAYPSTTQLAASAVGQQAAQLGEQITSRNLNLQPTLKIRPGEPFYVSVQKSMVFPGPYEPIKLGGER